MLVVMTPPLDERAGCHETTSMGRSVAVERGIVHSSTDFRVRHDQV
jgi:hypothetical protein